MNEHKHYRENLPPPPPRIARLPVDHRGYPVPYFVAWIDGVPDHRIADPQKKVKAIEQKLCWICGDPLGQYLAFVIGPMCAVNRNTSEPPCHRDCAIYSVQACPFLTTPKQIRRTAGLPDQLGEMPTMLERNPGVIAVWITKTFQPYRGLAGEILFRFGEPTETLWFCEGRNATHAEVLASVESGLPALRELAEMDGDHAIAKLDKQCRIAEQFYPTV